MQKDNQDVVLQMDQSSLANGVEMLMVSVRLRSRALPIAWAVKQTEGNIGILHEDNHPEPWFVVMDCIPRSSINIYGV